MNIGMHGKSIARVDFIDGPSGNPHFCERGEPAREPCHGFYHRAYMLLSATHHGDHDEFWVVFVDSEGREVARRNARACEHIVWLNEKS